MRRIPLGCGMAKHEEISRACVAFLADGTRRLQ
jgi:hypothetical protein